VIALLVAAVTACRNRDPEPLALGSRCSNHGAVYDGEAMVEIPAGGSRTLKLPTPHATTEPGTYRLALRHEVVPGFYPGRSYQALSGQDDWGPWPEGVFTGVAEAKAFTFAVE
jgi:hypothetical protein